MDPWKEFVEVISKAGLLGVFGGLAAYVHKIVKGQQVFTVGTFAANIALSYFIGTLAGDFVGDSEHRDGLIAIAGFCTFPLLDSIEATFTKYVKAKGFIK